MHEKVSQPVESISEKIYDQKRRFAPFIESQESLNKKKHIKMLDLLYTFYQWARKNVSTIVIFLENFREGRMKKAI